MTKIQPIKNLRGYNISLHEEVCSLRVSKEQVKKLYGDELRFAYKIQFMEKYHGD